MTDTAPAPTVMRSRQAAGLAVAPVGSALPASQDAGRLATEIHYAEAIAKAGDMLPASYRMKPGAVLLVNQWAQKHDVDILTAMQTVAFVQGRPVIDATMQRALAERAGYRIKVLDDECTDETAKVEVWRGDERLGSATYTIAQARTANLAGKDNWKKNPGDMLVARATTRAIKRHAPSVLLGLLVGDEVEQADTLAPLTSAPDAPHAPAPADPAPAAEPEPPADIVDAEVVEPDNEPSAEAESETLPLTAETLKVRISTMGQKQSDVIRKAAEIAAEQGVDAPGSLTQIVASPVLPAVLAWLDSMEADF